MNPQKYQQFTAEEFAQDDAFIAWVLTQQYDSFWVSYVEQCGDQVEVIKLAKHMILVSNKAFSQVELSQVEHEEMRSELLREIHSTDQETPVTRKISFPVWSRWAASIAAFVVIGIGLYTWLGGENQLIYETAYGEIQHIQLPDGSMVNLHANSVLKVRSEWKEGADRVVCLDGEAYFDVEKKPATLAKFTVHTSDLKVEVLGTEFNVNSRNEQTQVVLNEGEVNLKLIDHEQDSILMKPGDLVAFSRSTQTLEVKQVNPQVLISWKEGIQLFEKTSLITILDKMEEIYGVSIELKNEELAERHLTIGIPVQNLEIAFEILENILGTTLTQKNTQSYWLE